eukprot:c15825_g1_i2.p1 GENE.c15825_g1_i2~~c15825_g1_i2.p1  ORF type:complete len:1008 (-),score=360.13 c15825_g1_i2:16-3039(-)
MFKAIQSTVNMRGLSVFISDLRLCQTKEEEQKRVDQELAHIRQKFISEVNLPSYHKKKYVWKMLYIFMLGYELDFGHMEALNLACSHQYSEKSVGYLACTLLLNEGHELLSLLINTLRLDILHSNPEFQTIALACTSNIASKDFAEALAGDVIGLLDFRRSTATRMSLVKKRACLCLLRLFRKVPEVLNAEEFEHIMIYLLEDDNIGVLTTAMGLFLGTVARNPKGYENTIPLICRHIKRLMVQKEAVKGYTYYHITSPWLQGKLLRSLTYFPPPSEKRNFDVIEEALSTILKSTEPQKNVNKSNAVYSIFFEAIGLIAHYGEATHLLSAACIELGRLVKEKDSNIRFVALQSLANLAEKNNVGKELASLQHVLLESLFNENDPSIRQRYLDVIFYMCEEDSVKYIVGELLLYLEKADYKIKEDLVLKIAILCERHSSDLQWYMYCMLTLITHAGDFIADDVWWRVVQVVTNNDEVQKYATEKIFAAMQPKIVHETVIKVACQLLGEYSDLITSDTIGPQNIFDSFHSKFGTLSTTTKSMVLTTYAKLLNIYPFLGPQITSIFHTQSYSIDSEVQQRSCEYLNVLDEHINSSLQNNVFAVMPKFPERESSVLRLMRKKIHITDKRENEEKENSSTRQKSETTTSLPTPSITTNTSTISKTQNKNQIDDSILIDTHETILAPQVNQKKQPENSIHELLGLAVSEPSLTQNNLNQSLSYSNPLQQQPQTQNVYPKPNQVGGFNLDDLLGTSTPQQQPIYDNSAALAEHKLNVLSLQCLPVFDGLLYDDSEIQVGIKIRFQKFEGKIAIYIVNKKTVPFINFTSVIPPVPYLEMSAKAPSNILAGGQQAQHLILVKCLQAFYETPKFEIRYTVDSQYRNLSLNLPVSFGSFLEPDAISSEQFFNYWNSCIGNGKDKQKIFKPKNPTLIEKSSLFSSLTNIKLSALTGIDPNPNNGVGYGRVTTTNESFTVMVRLEANPRDLLLRVSVRSNSPELSSIVEQLILFQLADTF